MLSTPRYWTVNNGLGTTSSIARIMARGSAFIAGVGYTAALRRRDAE